MLWRGILADVIVVAHAAYVGFVVLGLVAILAGVAFRWQWVRNPWFRWTHLTMIGIVVAEALAGIPCPLTVWEHQLRKGAGQVAYAGDFIGYWTHRLLFFRAEPWVFTVRLHSLWPRSPGGIHSGATSAASLENDASRNHLVARYPSDLAPVHDGQKQVITLLRRAAEAGACEVSHDAETNHRKTNRAGDGGCGGVPRDRDWRLPAAAETCLSPFVKRLGRPGEVPLSVLRRRRRQGQRLPGDDRREPRQRRFRNDHPHARPRHQGK